MIGVEIAGGKEGHQPMENDDMGIKGAPENRPGELFDGDAMMFTIKLLETTTIRRERVGALNPSFNPQGRIAPDCPISGFARCFHGFLWISGAGVWSSRLIEMKRLRDHDYNPTEGS
ncbi:hypothetical protein Ga0100231_024735 [Opitutaceae bacterium TAV4]|nr:hypothetical protein Ga0100231_024735 [Opitutaceae bacterium TAV4]RRK00928.1 hypothetical protein Ga0100230_024465 [Opitutaceae bacterium TAV3]